MSGERQPSEAPEAIPPSEELAEPRASRLKMGRDRAKWLIKIPPSNPGTVGIRLKPIAKARLRESDMSASAERQPGGGSNGSGDTPPTPEVEGRHESGAIEIPEGDRRVVATRDDLDRAFSERLRIQQGAPNGAGRYSVVSRHPKYQEGVLDEMKLIRIGQLLGENTLSAHQEAQQLLEECGLLAHQRWEMIHTEPDPDRRHELSNVDEDKINPLVLTVWDHMNLKEGSKIVELGSGMGGDLLELAGLSQASFIGIDSSKSAVNIASQRASRKNLEGRLEFRCNTYDKELLKFQKPEERADGLFLCSGGHYDTPLVARDIKIPMMARSLKPDGIFCMAMKVAESASALAATQRRLVRDAYDPYHSSVDTVDRIYRFYPNSLKELLALLEPSFDIINWERMEVKGYDKKGDVEVFYHIVARPKPGLTGSEPQSQRRRIIKPGRIAA